jgi:hypothetical protein
VAADTQKAKRPDQAASAPLQSTELQQAARSRVQDLAKVLGNDEIVKRIEQGSATREQMLAFVAAQLGTVRDIQQQELHLSIKGGASFDWWRLAGNGTQGPDPNQWHKSAKAYEAATEAICRGDLKRGQQLLEEAHRIQQETMDKMTDLVDRQQLDGRTDPSGLAAMVATAPSTGACTEPLPIRDLVNQILHVNADVPTAPDNRLITPNWANEEEEDEDDEDGEGGKP